MSIITDLGGDLAPFGNVAPESLTLKDVQAWTLKRTDLDKPTAQKIASATNTVAKGLGGKPETTPASPAIFAPLLREARPALYNISKRHWQNATSLVIGALDQANLTSLASRPSTPLSPAWYALRQRLPDEETRRGLVYLMRFCSAHGIGPDQVGPEVLAELLADMMANPRVKHPRENHQRACKLWNKMRKQVEEWPQIELPVPSYSTTYSPELSFYPPSLKADLDAYLKSRKNPKLNEKNAKPIADTTQAQIEGWVRRYAGALVAQKVPPGDLKTLADLVTPERYALALEFFLGRNSSETSAQTSNIAQALKVIAKRWVGLQGPTYKEIKAMRSNVREEREGLTEKNKKRLYALLQPDNCQRLLKLPRRLAEIVEKEKPTPRQAALLMQTAVAIDTLRFCPMRIANLAALDWKKHIVDLRPDSPSGRFIFISAKEVKNKVPLDVPVPAAAWALVEKYLSGHQPLLAGGFSTALFPGHARKSKGSQVLGKQISKAIHEHIGLEVNPHLFRHFLAALYLKAHPGDYETVRRFLGHKDAKTTMNFYCDLQNSDVFKHLDKVVTAAEGKENDL